MSPDGPLSVSKQGHASGHCFYRAVSLYNPDFALFMGCVFSEKKKVSAVSLQPRAKYGGGGGGMMPLSHESRHVSQASSLPGGIHALF